MKEALTNSDMVLSLVFAILDFLMCLILLWKGIQDKKAYVVEMSLIAFGLFYDAFICALSGLLPEATIETQGFKAVSLMRYILHGLLIPLLFPICGYQIQSKKKVWIYIGYALCFVFMVLGVLQGCFTKLELHEVGRINRYVTSADTPSWVKPINMLITIFPIIPLIATGIYVWIKRKRPYLFLSGILMFIFAALGGAIKDLKDLNFLISMVGEVFMTLFFLIHVIFDERHPVEDK